MTINIHSIETTFKNQLKDIGYFNIEIKNEKARSFSVIAEGALRSIFILVIFYLVSEHLKDLTNEEILDIKQNADTFKKEPWAAVMRVNEKGELVDSIQWTNLSRQRLVS